MTPDNISKMQAVLTDKGILPGTLDTSGALVRCGTTDKPTSKNAAYIIHMDAPASIWWQNWQSGESGTWTAKSESTMTPAERKALHSRIEADRAARTAEQQARHAEAAAKAADIWETAPTVEDSHAYLSRKNVPSLGLKLAQDGRLIVPILNEAGGLQSLQFIGTDGGKRFLTGGKTPGGFFSIPAKDGGKSGPLLIAEGFATAASLHLATGHAVLVAFNAGNLPAVAKMARRLYPEREIILAADNDVNTEGNPGLTKATEAASTIGARLALCPAHEGKATDFNDLHNWRSLEAVAAIIAEATIPQARKQTALRVLDLQEMLTIEMPPREYIVHPIIPEQGLCLLYAARGVGKTHAALSIAYAVASGGNVLRWTCPKPRPVLYIDGEMPFPAMQERLAALVQAHDAEPDPRFLRILTPDMQGENPMPNIATHEGQTALSPYLEGIDLVVVDNLATLARNGRANDEESWLPIQEWILGLRRRGISVLIVHHAGKNGGQRGTSAKEDVLDVVISLSRPKDYNPEEGARFEVRLTKARGIFGPDAEPFEARLESDGARSFWTVRSIEDVLLSQVRSLADDGMTQREIAAELEVSKSAVNRLCKKHDISTKGGK